MMASIEMREGWPGDRGAEAGRFTPAHAVFAVVDWPLPTDDNEETIGREVVTALSCALAACGSVAFRYDDPLTGATARQAPARLSMKDRLLELAGFGGERFGLVAASDPEVVATLFAYGGWSHACQVALVFDPECDPLLIFDALGDGLDWRGRDFPEGVRLLFGPGHDGDFAVVAAADRMWLDRFRAALPPPQP